MLSTLLSLAWLVAAAACGVWLRVLKPKGRLLYTLLFFADLVMTTFELHGARAMLDMNTVAVVTLVLLIVRFSFLYILWNRKGRMVMSRHYRETIITATPDIQYRSRAPFATPAGGGAGDRRRRRAGRRDGVAAHQTWIPLACDRDAPLSPARTSAPRIRNQQWVREAV